MNILKKKYVDDRHRPIGAIFPEGGDALYEEPGTGIRLTAMDYAVKHGYENASEVEKAYQKEVDNGRRTSIPDQYPDSSTI